MLIIRSEFHRLYSFPNNGQWSIKYVGNNKMSTFLDKIKNRRTIYAIGKNVALDHTKI